MAASLRIRRHRWNFSRETALFKSDGGKAPLGGASGFVEPEFPTAEPVPFSSEALSAVSFSGFDVFWLSLR
tara:strand:+ start:2829 stop:3041 length:213 start_codon:yes stop_codon:yes gene_type:complete